MKKSVTFLIIVVAISSCTKPVDLKPTSTLEKTANHQPTSNIPDTTFFEGNYKGQIEVQVMSWNGKEQKKDTLLVYALNFSIHGHKFDRIECGCSGEIQINEANKTITFKSNEPACVSDHYKNWLIGEYHYEINGKQISVFHQDPDRENEDLKQQLAVGSQFLITSLMAYRIIGDNL